MNFQSESMAKAVEKPGPTAIANLGRVSAIGEQIGDLLLQLLAGDSRTNFFQGILLAFQHGMPKTFLWFACFSANHGSRDIAVVAGFSSSRKHVQNNQ